MNSLDLYDITVPVASTSSPSADAEASSSSTTEPERAPSPPTLNEEVSQVIGQLGRFWGGVRKQSQTAFESARKDFSGVVTQAQKEFQKFNQRPATNTGAPAEISEHKYTERADAKAESGAEGSDAVPTAENSSSESVPTGPNTELASEQTTENISASSSFFARLQSSLPPNLTPTALATTLQRHLPENLQHGLNFENANADFVQLRTALVANIQSVQQGTTVQQAEKLAEQYMHKGEALFKEAGEFLKDAVKVVPPEDGEQTGVVWDGTDIWTMPSAIQTNVGRGGSRKGKDRESDVIFSMPRAAGKRAEVLLRRLKSDPALIRRDPQLDDNEAAKEMWTTFVKDEVEARGGINGELWTTKTGAALEGHDKDDDPKSLASLRDLLVPAELTNDIFWTRYFFRVHQIEREEERRKALLAGANQDEEDFSWEDEDDGEGADGEDDLSQSPSAKTPMNASSSSTLNTSPKLSMDSTETAVAPPQPNATSQTTSPRESEDSYDVVSSGNVSSTGGRVDKTKERGKDTETGDDSDWE